VRLLDDAALRERLAAEGLETAQRFSHIEEARRHIALYEQWVAEKRRPHRG
jgi:hypothetical protein